MKFSTGHLKRARFIADFQFGNGSGDALFPDGSEFLMSKSGRIRQIIYQSTRIATVRAKDGLLTLSLEGACRLHSFISKPGYRVTVNSDAVPFILEGKTAFARHVLEVDPAIRAGDEVMVVDENDKLLGTGRAVLCASEMLEFNLGAAVDVRTGAKERK